MIPSAEEEVVPAPMPREEKDQQQRGAGLSDSADTTPAADDEGRALVVGTGAPRGRRRGRHGLQTRTALVLTAVTLAMVGIIAVLYGGTDSGSPEALAAPHRYGMSSSDGRGLEDGNGNGDNSDNDDWSSYACDGIFTLTEANTSDRCSYAQTCNGGEGLFASFVFCHTSVLSTLAWCLILSPFLLTWLVTLFRMLGTTAEDYFSPSLEMFSLKMGLPPRFAGVTLLALGNGAADVSATVNAIVKDPANGYKMSLGALTGAGMFVGTVVAGVVIVTADGVPCRGALVRDVVAMIVTLIVVFCELKSGAIGKRATTVFFVLYFSFVLIVLIADIYHRAVVKPRLARREVAREVERQAEEGRRATAAAGAALDELADASDVEPASSNEEPSTEMRLDMPGGNAQRSTSIRIMPTGDDSADAGAVDVPIGNRALNAVLTALSNYDKYEETGTEDQDPGHAADGWGIDGTTSDQSERPVKLHGKDGVLNRHGHGGHHANSPNGLEMSGSGGHAGSPDSFGEGYCDSPYSAMVEGMDEICADDTNPAHGFSAHNWTGAYHDCKEELRVHCNETYDDIFNNDENSILDKFLLAVELPFIIMRKATVPIPCEGYYCRAVVALSLAISPVWFGIYFLMFYDINLFWTNGFPYVLVMCAVTSFVGALIVRFAPGGDGVMKLALSGPIAFYGFIVAATWIDAIADQLVSLLTFLGVVCRIPSAIMGLTILAWGNSMGDLSANITMARKGLANMAMTACFAGPVFNILIGLGLGFSTLRAKTGNGEMEVTVSPSITTGFIFILVNCIMVIVSGVFCYAGAIPKTYGYFSLALYIVYVIASVALQF